MTEIGALIGAVLVTHNPRMAALEGLPDFLVEMAEGAVRMGEAMRAAGPEVLVVQSAHWPTTLNWYAASHGEHEGFCVGTESPELIPGTAYRRKGDPPLASAMVESLAKRKVPAHANDSPHYRWDYGLLVPLLRLDPASLLPVVPLSTCITASLEECRLVGEAVREAAEQCGRRVLFVASGALSHKLVRNPPQWPSPDERRLDERFIELLCAGDLLAARDWLPEFARAAAAEVGGRHLATLLGALAGGKDGGENDAGYRGRHFGYGPASGTGNANLLLLPADAGQ